MENKSTFVQVTKITNRGLALTVKDKEYFALMYDVTPGEYVNVVISEIGENPVNSISTNMKYIQESYLLFSHNTNALKNKNKSDWFC